VGLTVSTTKVEDVIDGGPLAGCCRWVRQHPPPSLKTTSMAGPLGALLVGSIVSTTEVEDDINGGPPGGHCQRV
jgi:hypothetical protein